MKFGILAMFAFMLLLSAVAFASDAAEDASGEAVVAGGGEAGSEAVANEAAGEEGAHQGVDLGTGAQLMVMGAVASVILLAILYFLLTKRR